MTFFFLSKDSCSLSANHPDILLNIQKELLEVRGYRRADDMKSADVILLQEAFSFKNWRYLEHLESNPVVSQYAHKLYVVNTDDAAAGLLRGIYCSLAKRRFDPSIHRAVPYGYFPNKVLLNRRDEPRSEPEKLACWRGNLRSNKKLRSEIFSRYSNHPDFTIESTSSWLNHDKDEQEHYFEVMISGKFSLCLAGWAPGSFRIFESMALGICPVIIADEFLWPQGIDWNGCSLRLEEHKLSTLPAFLRAAESDYQKLGAEAKRVWDLHFHPDKVMSYYTDQLLDCIENSLGKGSLSEEKIRWRSRKMFLSNNWTVPQRIQNKVNKFIYRYKYRSLR